MNRGTYMLWQSGIFIGKPTCCVEVDVHTAQDGTTAFPNYNSLSSHMSHNYLKLLTLCPYELIKMLNMFISITFKQSIAAMHQTSCQPSACYVFPGVCLSICQQHYSKSYLRISIEFYIFLFDFVLYSYILYCFGVVSSMVWSNESSPKANYKKLKIHHLQKYDYNLCTVN